MRLIRCNYWYSTGTYEKVEEEEEEIYEVINVHKLKSATPNLRVINLYGINFVDDSHIDAFSSNCIQLECLAVNYCSKVTGSTMKTLFQRSKRLRCLLMNQTSNLKYILLLYNIRAIITKSGVTIKGTKHHIFQTLKWSTYF